MNASVGELSESCLSTDPRDFLAFSALDLVAYRDMPSTCFVCKSTAKGVAGVSLHRIPPMSEPVKHQQWLRALIDRYPTVQRLVWEWH